MQKGFVAILPLQDYASLVASGYSAPGLAR
jgi:hypothetical protein